jgi:hypothetical protein
MGRNTSRFLSHWWGRRLLKYATANVDLPMRCSSLSSDGDTISEPLCVIDCQKPTRMLQCLCRVKRSVSGSRLRDDGAPHPLKGITLQSRFADQKKLAKAAILRLERRTSSASAAPLASCVAQVFAPHIALVGDRLTVGQRTLTPPVLVRIQVPQPLKKLVIPIS